MKFDFGSYAVSGFILVCVLINIRQIVRLILFDEKKNNHVFSTELNASACLEEAVYVCSRMKRGYGYRK